MKLRRYHFNNYLLHRWTYHNKHITGDSKNMSYGYIQVYCIMKKALIVLFLYRLYAISRQHKDVLVPFDRFFFRNLLWAHWTCFLNQQVSDNPSFLHFLNKINTGVKVLQISLFLLHQLISHKIVLSSWLYFFIITEKCYL